MSLRDAVDTGIRYSQYFEAYEAIVAAGLDLEKYEKGEYDHGFLARVIAWHRGHVMVRQHSEDAVNRRMRRK